MSIKQVEDKECVKESLFGKISQDDVIVAIVYLVSSPLGGSMEKILWFDNIILAFSSKYGHFSLHLTAKEANLTQAANFRSQKLH